MKVCCDFLPNEYKAVRRNLKLMAVAVVAVVLTGLIMSFSMWGYQRERVDSEEQVRRTQSTISMLEGQIAALSYDQGKIQDLIQRFRFIQQAMGSDDFPYLEFYQALEEAVPINEDTGLRRIAIQSLSNTGRRTWTLTGIARHWDDILAFEDALNQSVLKRPVEHADGTVTHAREENFQNVRVFKVERSTDGSSVAFDMQFDFIRG